MFVVCLVRGEHIRRKSSAFRARAPGFATIYFGAACT